MKTISYEDYINALKIVKAYHVQLKHDIDAVDAHYGRMFEDGSSHLIIPFLKAKSNVRTHNAIYMLLVNDINKRNIPFTSVMEVTVSYFVEHYNFRSFRNIRNFGETSFLTLKELLDGHGYQFRY